MLNVQPKLDLHLLATPTQLSHFQPAELASELKQLSSQTASEQLMSINFETVAEQLQLLDRMYFEMDGSFVWSGEEPTQAESDPVRWQIDGMIYDVGGRIQRVEIKGMCPKANWLQLLSILHWPAQSLIAYNIASAAFEELGALEDRIWN